VVSQAVPTDRLVGMLRAIATMHDETAGTSSTMSS
jgi:hypothetical protein